MKYLIPFLQLTAAVANAQSGTALLSFKEYAESISVKADSTIYMHEMIKNNTGIDYLAPLAIAYSYKQILINRYSKDRYYDNLSQTISFMGDYKSVLECLQLENEPVDTSMSTTLQEIVNGYKGAYLVDAKKMIIEKASSRNVVMINEAHCKPLHRAFVYSLLADFYKKGFRYLAMETFNNFQNHSLSQLTANTGYYTCEPVGGELIRKALGLGFRLVSYEDTVQVSNSRQRDSAQAMHLYELIRKDPLAKVLVLAGYGHIEKVKSNGGFTPMAYQFKNISGINPFCIDQTLMTEEGNSGFSSLFYNLLLTAYPAKQPSVLIKDNQPVDLLEDTSLYDLKIIHPRAAYFAGRATWYSLENERKPVMVSKHPENTFLVQAYYLNEWVKNPLPGIIPADQTYIRTRKKSYVLFLKRGRYKIIYRDMNYKILGIHNIDID